MQVSLHLNLQMLQKRLSSPPWRCGTHNRDRMPRFQIQVLRQHRGGYISVSLHQDPHLVQNDACHRMKAKQRQNQAQGRHPMGCMPELRHPDLHCIWNQLQTLP